MIRPYGRTFVLLDFCRHKNKNRYNKYSRANGHSWFTQLKEREANEKNGTQFKNRWDTRRCSAESSGPEDLQRRWCDEGANETCCCGRAEEGSLNRMGREDASNLLREACLSQKDEYRLSRMGKEDASNL